MLHAIIKYYTSYLSTEWGSHFLGTCTSFEYRLLLKCDGTRAETRFRLSPKRTSPFKSAEASVQSTTGSRGVRVSGSNAGYTMFRGSVKSTGYSLHSPVSPSLPPRASSCTITFQQDSTYFLLKTILISVIYCLLSGYSCEFEVSLTVHHSIDLFQLPT